MLCRDWNFLLIYVNTNNSIGAILLSDTGMRLAKAGYAVFGIDCEGHGKSDGLSGYIQNFDDLVLDSVSFFGSVAGTYN